jgi:hypothetical protein
MHWFQLWTQILDHSAMTVTSTEKRPRRREILSLESIIQLPNNCDVTDDIKATFIAYEQSTSCRTAGIFITLFTFWIFITFPINENERVARQTGRYTPLFYHKRKNTTQGTWRTLLQPSNFNKRHLVGLSSKPVLRAPPSPRMRNNYLQQTSHLLHSV